LQLNSRSRQQRKGVAFSHSATNIHSHSFPRVYPCARPLPPYSFNKKAKNERVKWWLVRQKKEMKKFVGHRKNERAELSYLDPAIWAALTFSSRKATRDSRSRNVSRKDPGRKHDSHGLMISLLDKDMETLPRQDASTPVLRQIN